MTDYDAIRDYYKDLGKPTASSKAAGVASAARKAAEQASYRSRQAARVKAAQAKASQAAQAQAEKKRREQLAKASAQAARVRVAQEKAAADAKARKDRLAYQKIRERSAEMRALKVKKGDTAESLGKRYGVDPKMISDATTSLRPGQVIDITGRGVGTFKRMEGYRAELAAQDRPDERAEYQAGMQERVFTGDQPLSRWIDAHISKPLGEFFGETGEFLEGKTPYESLFGPAIGQEERERREFLESELARYDQAPSGDAYKDPSYDENYQAVDYRDPKEAFIQKYIQDNNMTRAEYEEYRQEKGNFGIAMRYTGQAFAEAFRLQEAGLDYSHVLRGGTVPGYEGAELWITSAEWNGGTGDPMWEQFTPQMQEKIIGLGYVMVEQGLWVPATLQPPEYGMGGYSFPGYGGGYGGGYGAGGGEYEYLSRGGFMRRKQGGGASRGERVRIFPEGVSPAHWRI